MDRGAADAGGAAEDDDGFGLATGGREGVGVGDGDGEAVEEGEAGGVGGDAEGGGVCDGDVGGLGDGEGGVHEVVFLACGVVEGAEAGAAEDVGAGVEVVFGGGGGARGDDDAAGVDAKDEGPGEDEEAVVCHIGVTGDGRVSDMGCVEDKNGNIGQSHVRVLMAVVLYCEHCSMLLTRD